MRTTLSLDDDVAAALERLRKARDESFKDLVNEALRRGLKDMKVSARRRMKPFRTRAVSLGRCRLGSLDNVAEALALAEGESYR
ncbi:MAG: ribbon-helix-helix protein, CopG family [Burkholderiales bacterium]|nr:ribbon-helix-helix protein, CopG family [Burkholderiales bacterium]